MRTATAWTSKLKAEALGRTYKVQESNTTLATTTAYRGAAACYAINYQQILYLEACKCEYLDKCNLVVR
jgi:hypothetical protein